MLLAEKRKRQEVAGKVNHPEYVYRLNGDPREFDQQIRVRPQGDPGPAQNYNRDRQVRPPPFAVDDDGGGGRGRGAGNPPGNHNNGGPAAYPGAGAANAGFPSRNANQNPNHGNNNNNNGDGGALVPYNPYASPASLPSGGGGYPLGPYGGMGPGMGGHAPGPGVQYAPTLPQLPAPSGPLPGPLPPVYRPKPPLVFHPSGGGGDPYGYPYAMQTPPPPSAYYPSGPTIELSPVRASRPLDEGGHGSPSPYDRDHNPQRPYTSPALPALHLGGDGPAGRRRQSAGAGTPPLGNGGGGFNIFGGGGGNGGNGNGLSEQEEKLRDKLAARRRAQELQEDNARQMAEREQRKREERAREAAEAAQEEARLRREREERARREQAEVEREAFEKELKMAGPKAAQALIAQREADKQRKEEEERAKRQARAQAAAPAPTIASHDGDGSSGNGGGGAAPSESGRSATPVPAPTTASTAPLSQPAGLRLAPLPTQPYLYPTAGTGGALEQPPPFFFATGGGIGPSTTQHHHHVSVMERNVTGLRGGGPTLANQGGGAGNALAFLNTPYTYETENIKRELREISANQRELERKLEEQLAQARAKDAAAAAATTGLTAPTYLRTGAPAPTTLPFSSPTDLHRGVNRSVDMTPRAPLTVNIPRSSPGGVTTPTPRSPLAEGVIWKLSPSNPSLGDAFSSPQQRVSFAHHTSIPSFLDGSGSGAPAPALERGLPAPMGVSSSSGAFVDRDLTLSTHMVYAACVRDNIAGGPSASSAEEGVLHKASSARSSTAAPDRRSHSPTITTEAPVLLHTMTGGSLTAHEEEKPIPSETDRPKRSSPSPAKRKDGEDEGSGDRRASPDEL